MLTLALLLTGLGFGLLVLSLVTGDVQWAWACIAVGVAGLAFLVADLVRRRRRPGRSGER